MPGGRVSLEALPGRGHVQTAGRGLFRSIDANRGETSWKARRYRGVLANCQTRPVIPSDAMGRVRQEAIMKIAPMIGLDGLSGRVGHPERPINPFGIACVGFPGDGPHPPSVIQSEAMNPRAKRSPPTPPVGDRPDGVVTWLLGQTHGSAPTTKTVAPSRLPAMDRIAPWPPKSNHEEIGREHPIDAFGIANEAGHSAALAWRLTKRT